MAQESRGVDFHCIWGQAIDRDNRFGFDPCLTECLWFPSTDCGDQEMCCVVQVSDCDL